MTQSHRRPTLAVILAVLAALLLSACGGATAAPTVDPGQIELETPDVTIDTYQGAEVLGGEQVTLSGLVALGKPVVVNFYAALCPPCRAEMPDFQRVYEERGHEFTLIGIDIGPQQLLGSREEGQALLDELDISYPAGTTFDPNVVRAFTVVAMPTTLFIRADGSLLREWSGFLTEEKINEFIDHLVAT